MMISIARFWIVAALIAAAATAQSAQESFNEAKKLLRMGDKEGALAKLQEVVQLDPSNTEAFGIWRETEAELWQWMLIEGGEMGQIAQYLMGKAKLERGDVSRDEGRIQEVLDQALRGKTFGERAEAMRTLRQSFGEFAVPALVSVLQGDGGETQNQAILALVQIGTGATLPLMAALETDDAAQRRNVCAALVQIEDRRAAPAFARLMLDSDAGVREAAARGLEKLGMARTASALDLYLEQAKGYLNGGIAYNESQDVIWVWENGSLQFVDVPNSIHTYEMAKLRAHEAVALDPANADAQALLATAYVVSAAAIEEGREGTEDVADRAPYMRAVALGLGRDVVRRALDTALDNFSGAQQIALVDTLAQLETTNGLANSPLLRALDSKSPGVAAASALAIADLAGPGAVPKADRLVAVLGDTVSLRSLRRVKVIGVNAASNDAVVEASNSGRGVAVDASATGRIGIKELLIAPGYDIYVVADDLADTLPEAVIQQIRESAPDAKVLVLSSSDNAEERFGERADGLIEGPLTADSLVEKAIELVEQADGGKADDLARRAGIALGELGDKGVKIDRALPSLVEQLGRAPAIAVPAAHAIGAGGTLADIDALVAVIGSDADNEVRSACALAAGKIFARTGQVPAEAFDALVAIAASADTDADVRQAVAIALGHGKTPGQINKLSQMMRQFAGTN
jgi:HEAT repeat protein